ncbi:MAG: hypothetical protein HFJ55_05875 [Clostridia bacterium]|jgi:ABC-2 type transport system permease protein|nr:hypothetical protein [Clostridia bacterium]
MQKIRVLTKIFLKDYYSKLNLFNKKTNKVNKKSIYLWLIIIVAAALAYISLTVINYLDKIGQPILFLKIYLPIVATIMIYQLIILVCSILYYSKDIKDVIYLPVKPIEILMGKINTIIAIMYLMEALLLLIPLIMYGILIQKTIMYFIGAIITLAVFPILFTSIISILILLTMRLLKVIKNKEVLQIVVTIILISIMTYIIGKTLNEVIPREEIQNVTQNQISDIKINEINKKFIIIEPIIQILTNNQFMQVILNIIKILAISALSIITTCIIGAKIYLKEILRINDTKNMPSKAGEQTYRYKKENKIKSYLKNDLKKINRNSTFVIQNVLQYIFVAIVFAIVTNMFLPVVREEIKNEDIINNIGIEEFKIQSTMIIIGTIQIIYTLSNLSITAISREGKNAFFMKYIPIPLYKQFKIKALPQIVINTVIILMEILVIYLNFLEVPIGYFIVVFFTSMLVNIINSYILVLIDLKRPNLNWVNEESVVKESGSKLYQYVITIFTFLILGYLAKVFEGFRYINAIIIINIIFMIFIIILKQYIKRNIQNLFKKVQ